MKKFFVIREGWNSANQSSRWTPANPSSGFESRRLAVVGIVEADSEEEAIRLVDPTCYSNQSVSAVTNPRSIRGLTQAIRDFEGYYA